MVANFVLAINNGINPMNGVQAGLPTGYLWEMENMEQVKEAVAHAHYRLERDFLIPQFNKNKLTVNTFHFDGLALYNESTLEFFNNSMALLDPSVRKGLFGNPDLTIYTKVRDRVPTFYGEQCQIKGCIVADGCILEGKAENCVLFRQVTICAGAEVEDCVIMNDTVIGEGAELKCVILDKDVTVRPGSKLCGTKKNPIIVKRGEIV